MLKDTATHVYHVRVFQAADSGLLMDRQEELALRLAHRNSLRPIRRSQSEQTVAVVSRNRTGDFKLSMS